mgnify:CR=1 FL=1
MKRYVALLKIFRPVLSTQAYMNTANAIYGMLAAASLFYFFLVGFVIFLFIWEFLTRDLMLLFRVLRATDDLVLRHTIIELLLTIPARLSSLLPHMNLLLQVIIRALESYSGDLVNLG